MLGGHSACLVTGIPDAAQKEKAVIPGELPDTSIIREGWTEHSPSGHGTLLYCRNCLRPGNRAISHLFLGPAKGQPLYFLRLFCYDLLDLNFNWEVATAKEGS